MNYSAQVLQYFKQTPHAGSLSGPEILIGEAISSSSSDSIRFFVQIKNEQLKIVRFQANGSVVTIACAEFLAEWSEGKSLAELDSIELEIFNKALDLSRLKTHSALLAMSAFRNALKKGKR